jgi:lysophospholipid acyltransferase (LPLAT)-like uncharacterized protein
LGILDRSTGKSRALLKKLRQYSVFESVAPVIIAALIRFIFFTTRWRVMGDEIPDSYHKDGRPFIVCLWHDQLMLTPCFWKWKKALHVLASSHADGRLIAKVVENFSMSPVYGSTGKGFSAVKKIIQLIKSGECVAITPDGPRGPRHKLAPGAVAIAKLTKTDVIPFSFCVKRYFRLNSWDRLVCALPFNRGVAMFGAPISPATLESMSEEEAMEYVESRINDVSQKTHEALVNV